MIAGLKFFMSDRVRYCIAKIELSNQNPLLTRIFHTFRGTEGDLRFDFSRGHDLNSLMNLWDITLAESLVERFKSKSEPGYVPVAVCTRSLTSGTMSLSRKNSMAFPANMA